MSKANDFSQLTQALLDKSLTKEELLKKVQQEFSLIDFLVQGVGHSKAAVRYGCSNVLLAAFRNRGRNRLRPRFRCR